MTATSTRQGIWTRPSGWIRWTRRAAPSPKTPVDRRVSRRLWPAASAWAKGGGSAAVALVQAGTRMTNRLAGTGAHRDGLGIGAGHRGKPLVVPSRRRAGACSRVDQAASSAMKLRQGPLVRGGRLIERVSSCYTVERYGEDARGGRQDGAIHGAGQDRVTSVPQSQAQASASCGPARSGGEWVVKRSSRGRRSKMLSCSTCSIWLRLQRSRRTNLR